MVNNGVSHLYEEVMCNQKKVNQLKVCVIAGALSRCKTPNEFLCRLSRIVTAWTRTTARTSGTLRAAGNLEPLG